MATYRSLRPDPEAHRTESWMAGEPSPGDEYNQAWPLTSKERRRRFLHADGNPLG
jgi:hypothetical protein